jgi:hypothetical protein
MMVMKKKISARSMKDKKCMQTWVGKPAAKKINGRSERRFEDCTAMYIAEDNVNLIQRAQISTV